jgi:DNA-directed RNA polymerase subunit RPC12/RpoP
MGPVYTCQECGKTFKFKFKDFILCGECLIPIHEKINEKVKVKIIHKNKYT